MSQPTPFAQNASKGAGVAQPLAVNKLPKNRSACDMHFLHGGIDDLSVVQSQHLPHLDLNKAATEQNASAADPETHGTRRQPNRRR